LRYEALRAQILECLVCVEGFIDFGEDVDELGQETVIKEGRSFTHPFAFSSEAD
jgi:tRNA modification GTPase